MVSFPRRAASQSPGVRALLSHGPESGRVATSSRRAVWEAAPFSGAAVRLARVLGSLTCQEGRAWVRGGHSSLSR